MNPKTIWRHPNRQSVQNVTDRNTDSKLQLQSYRWWWWHLNTSMHSSRMRTAPLLTVSGLHPRGWGSASRGSVFCIQWGWAEPPLPLNRMTDRCKTLPYPKLRLRVVITNDLLPDTEANIIRVFPFFVARNILSGSFGLICNRSIFGCSLFHSGSSSSGNGSSFSFQKNCKICTTPTTNTSLDMWMHCANSLIFAISYGSFTKSEFDSETDTDSMKLYCQWVSVSVNTSIQFYTTH